MFRTASFVCVLMLSLGVAEGVEPGSPVRISGPVSVEPVMTVQPPESSEVAQSPTQDPSPVEVSPALSERVEQADLLRGGTAAASPARDESLAETRESMPLPATERIPLGPAMSGSDSEAGAAATGIGGIARTGGALAAVIGLILVLRLFFVKFSGVTGGIRAQLGAAGRSPSGVLFVLGRYPVSRGMSLVLLQLDQRVLLLSQTSAGFHTLSEIGEPSEVASILQKVRDESGESLGAKFSGMLKQFESDPQTLDDLDQSAQTQPVRLRRPDGEQRGEPVSPIGGYYEEKPRHDVRTGEDELRSRINRMREYGS